MSLVGRPRRSDLLSIESCYSTSVLHAFWISLASGVMLFMVLSTSIRTTRCTRSLAVALNLRSCASTLFSRSESGLHKYTPMAFLTWYGSLLFAGHAPLLNCLVPYPIYYTWLPDLLWVRRYSYSSGKSSLTQSLPRYSLKLG